MHKDEHARIAYYTTHLAVELARYTKHESGCLIWSGPVSPKGAPVIWIDRWTQGVRSIVWAQANGAFAPYTRVTCGNKLCVALAHIKGGRDRDGSMTKCRHCKQPFPWPHGNRGRRKTQDAPDEATALWARRLRCPHCGKVATGHTL